VLPRLIGIEKAMKVLVMARTMTGNELYAMGLATECAHSEQVLSRAMVFAEELATQCAPVVAAATKQLIWRSFDYGIDDFVALETRVLHQTMGKDDALEGGAAFFEKREPQWHNTVCPDWPDALEADKK
jgi:enoyl-CoA hydratase/carnithine racemase